MQNKNINHPIADRCFSRSFSVAGHKLALDRAVIYSLTSVYGIGLSKARDILKKVNICFDIKLLRIDYKKRKTIRNLVENRNIVEGRLKRRQKRAIEWLSNSRAYRGRRHQKNLPVRGQRTKTNAKTAKVVSKKHEDKLNLQFGSKSNNFKENFRGKKR